MSMFKIHKINFPNGKLITVKRKEHMTNMTNAKKFLQEKNDKKKLGSVLHKTDMIMKKMKKPQLTSVQVDKYISTKPINVMTNTVATLSVDRKEINWTDEKMEDSNKINMMKNWYNYYSQIENNLVVGAKAVYLVCRDLYDASQNLSPKDYELLKQKVHLSEGTISKYVKIGADTTCDELFLMNKLPESWTTLYHIAKQKDDENLSRAEKMKRIKANISLKSTASDIDVFMGVIAKVIEPLFKYDELESPKDFIRVAYDNATNVDPIALKMLKTEVANLVYAKIDEFNSIQKSYFFDQKKEENMRVEVSTNEKLIDKAYETAMKFLSKVKGKNKNSGKTRSVEGFERIESKFLNSNPIHETNIITS